MLTRVAVLFDTGGCLWLLGQMGGLGQQGYRSVFVVTGVNAYVSQTGLGTVAQCGDHVPGHVSDDRPAGVVLFQHQQRVHDGHDGGADAHHHAARHATHVSQPAAERWADRRSGSALRRLFSSGSGAMAGGGRPIPAIDDPSSLGAGLMCSQAQITDPEIQAPCARIIDSQQSEIDQMRAILERLR